MAKTVKSFSLESDIIEKIVKYKKDNNLSSDSAALERIMLAFNCNINYNKQDEKIDNIEGLLVDLISKVGTNGINNVVNNIDVIKNEEIDIINSDMDNTLNDLYSAMK